MPSAPAAGAQPAAAASLFYGPGHPATAA